MAVGYKNSSFVCDSLFPRLSSPVDSNKFFTFGTIGKREIFGDASTGALEWEDGSDWNVLTDGRSTSTFSCVQRGAASVVTDTEVRNQDAPLNAWRDHAFFLRQRLGLEIEKLAATKATTQANYPESNRTQLASSAQWSHADSDPYDDIVVAANAIRQATGTWPNTMVVGAAAWIQLIQHADVITHLRYSSSSLPDEAKVANIFRAVGIEKVAVAGAVKNTAESGAAESIGDVWGKHAVLAYVNPSPSIGMPSYGYRFNSSNDMQISRVEMPGKNATLLNAVSRDALEFVSQDSNGDSIAGYLIEDAVA